MPVYDAPPDEDSDEERTPRQSYNFAPGYHGVVYRADVPEYGAGPRPHVDEAGETPPLEKSKEVRYKLQSMKWGTY
jgi:hypothetical protein